MSRFAAASGTAHPPNSPFSSNESPGQHTATPSGEYAKLIQLLFPGPSVVAIIGAGSGENVTGICAGIAAELSSLGRRVVLVSVYALLYSSPVDVRDQTTFAPGPGRNIWIWPSSIQQMEFFDSPVHPGIENWLDSLRRNFDSVLLDCPALETAPGVAAIAALSDAAVLAVDGARTPKRQILLDQRTLRLTGVKLAGCILVKPR